MFFTCTLTLAQRLVLKLRQKATRKWPIVLHLRLKIDMYFLADSGLTNRVPSEANFTQLKAYRPHTGTFFMQLLKEIARGARTGHMIIPIFTYLQKGYCISFLLFDLNYDNLNTKMNRPFGESLRLDILKSLLFLPFITV